MAFYPLLACFCCIAFSINLTQADPEFPTLPDDYTATGTIRLPGMVARFRLYNSKSLKSSKFDTKSYGKRDQRYMLENAGAYGTQVSITSRPGHEVCSVVEGTARAPVKHEPFFYELLKNTTYVGIENVHGVDMKKWQFRSKSVTGFIITREDENGPVLYSIDMQRDGKMQFETFSSTSPTPNVFKYNKKGCKHRRWLKAFQNSVRETSFLQEIFVKN